MSARILLVEDDPALLEILKASVAYGGYASESVSRGEDAVRALEARQFDVLLLDLGLPDCEGGELLSRLRSFSDVPIIVVSGRGTERDKIEALDLGADDFVAKPFLPGELLARVRATLRRAASRHSARAAEDPARSPLRVGALTLDPLHNSAALGTGRVTLNAAEFRVLQLLARGGATVSRTDLLAGLYGDNAPAETNVVDVYISRLRAKLRDLPDAEDLVVNVRGQGWRLRIPR